MSPSLVDQTFRHACSVVFVGFVLMRAYWLGFNLNGSSLVAMQVSVVSRARNSFAALAAWMQVKFASFQVKFHVWNGDWRVATLFTDKSNVFARRCSVLLQGRSFDFEFRKATLVYTRS